MGPDGTTRGLGDEEEFDDGREVAVSVRVGINGFGRIGRNFVRAVLSQERVGSAGGESSPAEIEVVAVNDLTSARTNAQLLRCDSTHGRLGATVEVDGDDLVVAGKRIRVLAEREPAELPWGELGVDVVLEATGRFTSRGDAAAHLKGGATRVIISAPSPDADATFVVGVNDDAFDPEHDVVVSNASCTTNCFVPMVKVIEDAFGVTAGLMTTVHAYTNDQNLLDLPHSDLRRARAAAVNIVPSSTGAARATHLVLKEMKGRLDGSSLRVPVPDGSITDFTVVVPGELGVDDVNEAFRDAASKPPLERVLVYSEDPIVSSDIVGSPTSCTFDSGLTMVQAVGNGSSLVKVFGWYDNEWGYSNRLVDLVGIVADATAGGR
jgi:glyceraldehyde 3-phosphate dehydrogenase